MSNSKKQAEGAKAPEAKTNKNQVSEKTKKETTKSQDNKE